MRRNKFSCFSEELENLKSKEELEEENHNKMVELESRNEKTESENGKSILLGDLVIWHCNVSKYWGLVFLKSERGGNATNNEKDVYLTGYQMTNNFNQFHPINLPSHKVLR